MNKKLKIASAAVAVVMAGTMAFGMFGCNNGGNGGGNSGSGKPKLDENGKLTWAENTVINTAIGNNSADTGISYHSDNKTVLDATNGLMGKSWSENDLKPSWAKLENDLKVDIVDKWSHAKSGETKTNLTTIKDMPGGLSGVDMFTTDLSPANAEAVTNHTLLNLSDYLEYMPNYSKFLDSSDVIGMSLINSGDGDMYIAPYFDGNDDIERYVLMRKDLVEKILDLDLPTTGDGTYGAQGGGKDAVAQTYVTAFMGSTNYSVATTDPAAIDQDADGRHGSDKIKLNNNNTDTKTVNVTVNYTAALAAAKETGSALNTALLAAKSTLAVADLTSGNIIDLMNAVLESNVEVSGTKLINILRAYIDVAYTTGANNTPFYTTTNKLKRSSVFNSACAAWDVDLYVALGRCYVASGSMFVGDHTAEASKPKFLLSGRQYRNDRIINMVQLAGQLYGVRGLNSVNGYLYIDNGGKIQDARQDADAWNAVNAFSNLCKEGLVNFDLDGGGNYGDTKQKAVYETLSMHDYVQTQTSAGAGFNPAVDGTQYNMAPVVTPVSKWDVDGDGTHGEEGEIFRFTESWRTVKTSGVAVTATVANNPDKLSAVLAFIDYIYSPDGQILMTYGPRSTKGNTDPDGLWYATEAPSTVTLAQVADVYTEATSYLGTQYKVKDSYKSQYFIYDGKIYTGTLYGSRQIPTLTDESLEFFQKEKYNFTNFARRDLGTCLPIGNKDQGFEYQCTSNSGLDGSDIVAMCLANGTIKHVQQTLDKNNYWYFQCPTALPYTTTQTNAQKASPMDQISGLGGDTINLYNLGSDASKANFWIITAKNGFSETAFGSGIGTVNRADAAAIVKSHEDKGIKDFESYANNAFGKALAWLESRNG